MKYQPIFTTVIACIVVGAASFYGGMKFANMRRNLAQSSFGQRLGIQQSGFNRGSRFNNNNANGQGGQFGGGMRPVMGEIATLDDKSFTVKMPDGSSRIVILSENTSVNKATEAAKTDLKVGEQVNVIGSANNDGSLTAQNIQIK